MLQAAAFLKTFINKTAWTLGLKPVLNTYPILSLLRYRHKRQNCETADSTSHLENDYATSDARINPDGTLYHDLKTKPQKKPVKFEKPVERKDSTIYKTKTVTETEIVKVPRDLTWWQKTQIYGFWVILFILVIVYRKKILSFVKWLI